MLKIEVKPGENIERALKRYKRKRKNVKLMENLRERMHYEKDSVARRKQLKKAQYKEQYINRLEQ